MLLAPKDFGSIDATDCPVLLRCRSIHGDLLYLITRAMFFEENIAESMGFVYTLIVKSGVAGKNPAMRADRYILDKFIIVHSRAGRQLWIVM